MNLFGAGFRCVFAGIVAVQACSPSSDLDANEMALIDHWLGCIECHEGELQEVLTLAANKPQATTDTLGVELIRGPSAHARNNLRAQFGSVYHQLTSRLGPGNLPFSETEYIEHYLANITAIYRIRAAQALARVPGAAAKHYLTLSRGDSVSTSGDSLRPDVSRAIFLADSAFNP